MKLKDRWESGGAFRLLCAVLLNALFLAGLLIFIAPAFESNDDLTLAAFVDGQMAVKNAHIPYINYAAGLLLKGVYLLLGESVTWHTVGQYLLLFAGFTAVTWTLFKRLRFWQGAVVSLVMLLFFGVDTYTIISYTKTAAVAAVGGISLMLCAMESLPKGRRAVALALGMMLALFGAMLRFIEFLPCAALMAVLALHYLIGLIGEKELSVREKLRELVRYAAPFVLLLALAAGLYAVNELAWSAGRWGAYHEFDATRVALTDYTIPPYEDMPEQYEALELNENAVELFRMGNFFDTEKFGQDTMAEIIRIRSEISPSPSVGECLGIFLDKCIIGFFVNLHIYGFLIMAALWLGCGAHDARGWLTLIIECGLFAAFYLFLIWRGRYMIDRVDVGLFLAMFVVLSRLLEPKEMDRDRVLAGVALAAALALSFQLNRDSFRINLNEQGDKNAKRAAVDMLLSDSEHIYLAKLDTIDDTLYPPFTPAPAGYWDRIVLMGGWDFANPVMLDTLSRYGIENPYRDIIGNDRVYMIEDDIDSTMEYIHDYYDSDATAELVQPMSGATGLQIYKILD